jgi:hypothetical protein
MMDIFIPHGLQCYLIGPLASQTFYELYITFVLFWFFSFCLDYYVCLHPTYVDTRCKLILIISLYPYDNLFQTINRPLPKKVHVWAKPVGAK